jgi:hypothetical protein
MITFTCPVCKHEAEAEDRYDGNSIECSRCKNVVRVTALPEGLEDEPTRVPVRRAEVTLAAPVLVSDGRCSFKVVRLVAWVAFAAGLVVGAVGGCVIGRLVFPRSASA